jgi:PKD repeat protein
MRRNLRTLAGVGAVLIAGCNDSSAPTPVPSTLSAGPAAIQTAQVPRPGYHIVVFRDGVTDARALARALVAAHNGALEYTYEHAIKGFSAGLSDAAVASLSRHPDVVFVEQDGFMSAITTQTSATWGIDRVDQRDLPLSTTYDYAATGNGVNVYIIDTGIRTTHVEFGGRASSVFDAIGDGNGNVDCNGHGTHVSGTVAGSTYGIAKQAKLFSVRVLNCAGNGTTSGVIAGVDWVTANRVLPAAANMSLGGGISTALDQAVRNSTASGVTYAIAAGNDNLNACNGSPSRVTEALIVGATTSTDARSSFSNFGTCLDVFAPGSGITSAYGTADNATAVLSGTSMAAPHVAGAVARYLESNPGATPAAVEAAMNANASTGKVANPGTGSPNRLLFTGFMDGPPPVNQPPVAAFTVSCTSLSCTFNSSGSTDDVGITNRAWAFGDGTTGGNVISPAKSYASAGTYNVTLTVTDGGGLSNSITQAATVTAPAGNQPPVPQFTFNCTNLTCTFDSSGSTDDVAITGRQWMFGDGSTAGNVVSTTKTYAAAGTYSVKLNVIDGGGLWRSLIQDLTVSAGPPPTNQPPVASFTFSCTNLTCAFNSNGSTDDVGITNRAWTFGDGTTAGNVVGPSKTYAAGGTYDVTLTVTDGGGLSNSTTQAVSVTAPPTNQPPVASFTFSCTNLSCSFNSSGSTDDIGITARSWTFGDGTTAGNVISPSKSYAAAGTYNVTLTVTDGGGLTNSTTQSVTVTAPPGNQPPVPRFTISCSNLTCTFDSSTSTDDVAITGRQWFFGDGGTAGNVVIATRTYAAPGTYSVRLNVIDGGGLWRSLTQQVTVP